MAKLVRSSSGVRHLRWVREIAASLEAQVAHNDGLTQAQHQAIARESAALRPRVETLAAAVRPYRELVEAEHVRRRAEKRVARYLADELEREPVPAAGAEDEAAQVPAAAIASLLSRPVLSRAVQAGNKRTASLAEGAASMLRSIGRRVPAAGGIADQLDRARSRLARLGEELGSVEDPRRRPLRQAVDRAIDDARDALGEMDFRLRAALGPAFGERLSPELARGDTLGADAADEDDEDTAPPDRR